MMRRAATLLLLLSLACATRQPHASATRVVLISFDGLGASELARHSALPAFSRLQREGMFVQHVTPVTPAVTSATHVAILTGAPPQVSGIPGNRFHKPGTPWNEAADGFTADLDAETLLEAAHRAGKRVGSIAFPTVDGRNARRTADFGITYSDPVTRSRIVHLTSTSFQTVATRPRCVSTSLAWRDRQVPFTACSTADDPAAHFDTFEMDGHAADNAGWFSISSRSTDGLYGSWSKILRAGPDLEDVVLYLGSINRTVAYPESFRRLIDDEVGFNPGSPDEKNAQELIEGREGIDPDTFAGQNARFCAYFAGMTAVAIRHATFDLLLAYNPTVDKAAHAFFIKSGAFREAGERVRTRSFEAADQAVERVTAALDPKSDALVVTGDHGLAPIDTELHLKSWLAQHEFADWIALATGGGVANLYNTRGRAGEESAALKKALLATGLIERIDEKAHPNSGDLIAFAYPHVVVSASEGGPVTSASQAGQHGGLGSHAEFQTVLFAWGAGVRAGVVSGWRQTQIARYVSSLLGIDPPRNAE